MVKIQQFIIFNKDKELKLNFILQPNFNFGLYLGLLDFIRNFNSTAVEELVTDKRINYFRTLQERDLFFNIVCLAFIINLRSSVLQVIPSDSSISQQSQVKHLIDKVDSPSLEDTNWSDLYQQISLI